MITPNLDNPVSPVMLLDLINKPKKTRAIQDRTTIRIEGQGFKNQVFQSEPIRKDVESLMIVE